MGQMAIPLIIAAASTGAQVVNTRNTAKRQDSQLASSIRNQSEKQRRGDARVGEEVAKLQASTSADERNERLGQYMQTLQRGQQAAGLTPGIGSAAFRDDAQDATQDVQDYAGQTAELMSRIDAPAMQRQGEAFGYGKLATDIGLLGRESSGQRFIDELRLRAIRRNPWLDAASQFGMGVAGSMAGGAGQGIAETAGKGMYGAGFRGIGSVGY